MYPVTTQNWWLRVIYVCSPFVVVALWHHYVEYSTLGVFKVWLYGHTSPDIRPQISQISSHNPKYDPNPAYLDHTKKRPLWWYSFFLYSMCGVPIALIITLALSIHLQAPHALGSSPDNAIRLGVGKEVQRLKNNWIYKVRKREINTNRGIQSLLIRTAQEKPDIWPRPFQTFLLRLQRYWNGRKL